MDMASDFGAEDCGFDPLARFFLFFIRKSDIFTDHPVVDPVMLKTSSSNSDRWCSVK